jgi:hypothetical protein
MWYAPVEEVEEGMPLCVLRLEFMATEIVSFVRVWNYNKNRTHRTRGVRSCQIFLDNLLVFEGYY